MDVLKNKNALFILLGCGLSFFGLGMHFIAASWLVIDLTGEAFFVSVLVACQAVPGIISSPIGGAITDKFNKKKLAILSDIVRGGLVLCIPLLYIMGGVRVWELYLITVLITIMGSVFFPSLSGLIKGAIPEELYTKTFSGNATATQVGMMLGGMLAGVIITRFSVYTIFYIDAATYLLSALFLGCVIFQSPPSSASSPKKNVRDSALYFFKDIRNGLQYTLNNKLILFLIFLGLIPGTITSIINTLLGIYTKQGLHLGATAYGLLEASFAIGSIVVGLFILSSVKKTFSEYKLLELGVFFLVISFFILGFSQYLWISLIALFTAGAGIMFITPSRKSLLVKNVAEEYIGRVESLNFMFFSSIGPLVAMGIGLVVGYLGFNIIFYGIALALLGSLGLIHQRGKKSGQGTKEIRSA